MNHLKFHPLADAFPLIEGKDFEELVSSIKANGLRHAIITFDGMILDGRNRYRACEAAGVTPITNVFDGDDPLAFVIDENVRRRHLTTSQRAMAAAKIATAEWGGKGRKSSGNNPTWSQQAEITMEKASEAMGVSESLAHRADSIRSFGSKEQIEAVEKGKATVSTIYNKLDQTREKREARNNRTNQKRVRKMQINGQLWVQLRDALNLISGLPLPSDVVTACRANDRAGLVDKRLSRTLNWLKDFEHAWNSDCNKDAA